MSKLLEKKELFKMIRQYVKVNNIKLLPNTKVNVNQIQHLSAVHRIQQLNTLVQNLKQTKSKLQSEIENLKINSPQRYQQEINDQFGKAPEESKSENNYNQIMLSIKQLKNNQKEIMKTKQKFMNISSTNLDQVPLFEQNLHQYYSLIQNNKQLKIEINNLNIQRIEQIKLISKQQKQQMRRHRSQIYSRKFAEELKILSKLNSQIKTQYNIMRQDIDKKQLNQIKPNKIKQIQKSQQKQNGSPSKQSIDENFQYKIIQKQTKTSFLMQIILTLFTLILLLIDILT